MHNYWYYLDDGACSLFSELIDGHMRYPLELFTIQENRLPNMLTGQNWTWE